MAHVYRADTIGSLLRPQYLKIAREQLALSTQCGFASAGPGNAISEDAQENKLRLVGEVADRVWPAGS
jgi:methionine synthase II (cobalamin-independent)